MDYFVFHKGVFTDQVDLIYCTVELINNRSSYWKTIEIGVALYIYISSLVIPGCSFVSAELDSLDFPLRQEVSACFKELYICLLFLSCLAANILSIYLEGSSLDKLIKLVFVIENP